LALVLPIIAASPAALWAQVAERDRLLNCFYDARATSPATARTCLAELLTTAPNDVPALLELGYFEIAQKDDAAAIDAFSRAIAAGSPRADVRAQVGYLYLARQEREQALESFQAALALDPANDQVRMQTAYLLDQMDRKRDAKRLFEAIERETPDDALRRQACTAAEVLVPLSLKRLPDPYYVGLYTAPDWYSNIQQNAETLVALARKETNRDLKARIVQRLSLMRSPAARDYLMELLKKRTWLAAAPVLITVQALAQTPTVVNGTLESRPLTLTVEREFRKKAVFALSQLPKACRS
jgi:tetratricopeptide (TPR) repeat protein